MRILSVRRHFEADHSSSTYEFFALQRLTPEQREAVHALTGESARRHLSFHYMGDWSIPPDWEEKLLAGGYDIMVSESYDWWAVYLALPLDADLLDRLQPYKCDYDGNGFSVREVGDRMILYFGMQLDYGAALDVFGQELFEGLADMFKNVREDLLAGDLSTVWAMYETYGGYVEPDLEPEPVETLSREAKALLNVMVCY